MYELAFKAYPQLTTMVSYSKVIQLYGHETFKSMLAGENPYMTATPVDERDSIEELDIIPNLIDYTSVPTVDSEPSAPALHIVADYAGLNDNFDIED